MVKRIVCIVCMLLFLLPAAALADTRVFDEAELFTDAQEAALQQRIDRIRSTYQMDVVVLTTRDVPTTYSDYVIQDYADRWYEDGGFGMGEDQAGILYMIDMNNRAPVISTSGVMMDFITDSRLEDLFDNSYDALVDGRYSSAADRVISDVERYLRAGVEEGTFRYDAETGQRLSGMYNALTSTETLVALGAGLGVALVMYGSVSGKYNLKGKTYRYDTSKNAAFNLTRDEGVQVDKRVTRTYIQTSSGVSRSGGGSRSSGRGVSVHRSSSGRSHGGGVGRRF